MNLSGLRGRSISPYALTSLSLERTVKGVSHLQPVLSNEQRYHCYRQELRKEGMLPEQLPPSYEEYVIRIPIFGR